MKQNKHAHKTPAPVVDMPTALAYVMVIAAAADGALRDSEVRTIADLVRMTPAFAGFRESALNEAIGDCTAILNQDKGLDIALGLVKTALPEKLRETAYALACDVIAADASAPFEEMRWLEMLGEKLEISRLHAAAIERGARARFMRP
jgi:uncharacterized membrane protein YebE (DUF533 family)